MRLHNNTKAMKICGCGDCDQAADAAMRLIRTQFFATGNDDCLPWKVAVLRIANTIVNMMLMEEALDIFNKEPLPDHLKHLTAEELFRDKMHVAAEHGKELEQDVDLKFMASMFKRDAASNKIAAFVAEMAGSNHTEAFLAAGPTVAMMEQAGFTVVEGDANGPDNGKLLAAILAQLLMRNAKPN